MCRPCPTVSLQILFDMVSFHAHFVCVSACSHALCLVWSYADSRQYVTIHPPLPPPPIIPCRIHTHLPPLSPLEPTGVIEHLCAKMPEFFVALRTGHQLTSVSALYEYLGANLVVTMPAAVALAGWTPFPWGQIGKGPSRPTLQSLESLGVRPTDLEGIIDVTFNLHAGSPPMYLQEGALRPTIRTAFASLVMYYDDRRQAAEVPCVQV